MTIKELAEKSNRSISWVYKLAQKLGRPPTIEEIEARKGNRGRPKKYLL